MNNNDLPTAGGASNQNSAPVAEQPTIPQPTTEQPIYQPAMEQPVAQPQQVAANQPMPPMTEQPTIQPLNDNLATPSIPGSDLNGGKKKTNKPLIGILCGVGAAIVAALAVIFIPKLLNKKIEVNCTGTMDLTANLVADAQIDVTIEDGKIPNSHVVMKLDLKDLNGLYRDYESTFVDTVTEQYEKQCNDGYCTLSHEYAEGNYAIYDINYDEDGTAKYVVIYTDIKEMSAKQIADKVQDVLESEDIVCTQH